MNPTIEQLEDYKFRITIDEREIYASLPEFGSKRTIPFPTLATVDWAMRHNKKVLARTAKQLILQKTSLGGFFEQLPKRSHHKHPTVVKPGVSDIVRRRKEYQLGFNVRFVDPMSVMLFKLRYTGVICD